MGSRQIACDPSRAIGRVIVDDENATIRRKNGNRRFDNPGDIARFVIRRNDDPCRRRDVE
jgi:hypothetical protein